MALPSIGKRPPEKVVNVVSRRAAFSKYVASKEIIEHAGAPSNKWKCCDTIFISPKDIHKHISTNHMSQVNKIKDEILLNGDDHAKYGPLKKKRCKEQLKADDVELDLSLPVSFCARDEYSWLPQSTNLSSPVHEHHEGQILLFYHYRKILKCEHIYSWQTELCKRLNLTGKVRVAEEGLNVTVGGTVKETNLYIKSVLNHPLFSNMKEEDFKKSPGSAKDFPDGLKVGIYKESVPMGLDPEKVSYTEACKHLTPEEFHEAVEKVKIGDSAEEKSVFVDCRNFYESKIGKFEGAVCPDIRKFSYWPEYVDQNEDLFKDKNVYMYCTGGIRCERGSAYLKSKNICQDVFQLEGGIHKYIEKYPDGHFRGKLFVFDNRYHIKSNDDVLSDCIYCKEPWDKYEPCSSKRCYQLILSCDKCRKDKGLTACCNTCYENNAKGLQREQCECTTNRSRIPIETSSVSSVSNENPHKNEEEVLEVS